MMDQQTEQALAMHAENINQLQRSVEELTRRVQEMEDRARFHHEHDDRGDDREDRDR